MEMMHDEPDRQPRTAAGARARFGLPRHAAARCRQSLDVEHALRQPQWRPVQHHVVQSEVSALRVAQFDRRDPERVRKSAAEAGDGHLSTGQAGHQFDQQVAPWFEVRTDDDQHQQHHGNPDGDCENPGQPLRGAAHQNACPSPIYSSNASPPGCGSPARQRPAGSARSRCNSATPRRPRSARCR